MVIDRGNRLDRIIVQTSPVLPVHHQQVTLTAKSSLTLYHHPYQLAGLLGCNQCLHRNGVHKSLLIIHHCVEIHKKMSHYEFMPTSPAVPNMSCLSYLMHCEMGSRWPYSCFFWCVIYRNGSKQYCARMFHLNDPKIV